VFERMCIERKLRNKKKKKLEIPNLLSNTRMSIICLYWIYVFSKFLLVNNFWHKSDSRQNCSLDRDLSIEYNIVKIGWAILKIFKKEGFWRKVRSRTQFFYKLCTPTPLHQQFPKRTNSLSITVCPGEHSHPATQPLTRS